MPGASIQPIDISEDELFAPTAATWAKFPVRVNAYAVDLNGNWCCYELPPIWNPEGHSVWTEVDFVEHMWSAFKQGKPNELWQWSLRLRPGAEVCAAAAWIDLVKHKSVETQWSAWRTMVRYYQLAAAAHTRDYELDERNNLGPDWEKFKQFLKEMGKE